jgi:hypothetical protein
VKRIRVFVSFDFDHDKELFERLCTQSASFGFSVSGGSERPSAVNAWIERARCRIRVVDQMIVICGEHSEESPSMSAELRIAQQEQIPYFLLWGRREIMCTKPSGAKAIEGMYNWTQEILRDQIAYASRKARADEEAGALRRVSRTS